MADGTVSMGEGLGFKAQDSNELRRKQMNISDVMGSLQLQKSYENSVSLAANPPGLLSSDRLGLGSTLTSLDAQSSPSGFGPHSPNSAKSSSPSRKLQQVLQTEGTRLEFEARLLEIVGHLEDELNNSEDPFVLDVVTDKLLSIQQSWRKEATRQAEELAAGLQYDSGQERISEPTGPLNLGGSEFGSKGHLPLSSPKGIAQSPNLYKTSTPAQKSKQALFEDSLVNEAEARARVSQAHGNSYQLQCSSSEVQKSKPESKVLFNPHGDPYVEGDPNLGFPVEDTKPRYFSSTQVQVTKLGLVSDPASHASTSTNPTYQHKAMHRSSQPNRNWASLFRSEGPSSNMRLDFYPDLKKGKNAVVELDVSHLDENCWSHCLVGHFLDARMDFKLANSTAHKLWGKTTKYGLRSVRSDNAGFLFFEFRDEECQLAVLEGGPWFFSQKFLVLKKWRRMMTPTKISPSSIPSWVKLHNLPLECWTEEGLSRVASAIGQPKHVDQAAEKKTRLAYARVCVEIEAADDLPDDIQVTVDGESVSVRVEYQVMPPVCTVCKVFGHATSRCPRSIPHKQAQDCEGPRKEGQTVTKGTIISNSGGSAVLDRVTTPVVVVVDTSLPKVIDEDIAGRESEGEELNVKMDIPLKVNVDTGVLVCSKEVDSVTPSHDPGPGVVPAHPVPIVKPAPPDDKAKAVMEEAPDQSTKVLKPLKNKGSGNKTSKKRSSSSKKRTK